MYFILSGDNLTNCFDVNTSLQPLCRWGIEYAVSPKGK